MSDADPRPAIARISPAATAAALGGVRDGRVIDLARTLSAKTPRDPAIQPPRRFLTSGLPVAASGTTVVHEYVLASSHLGTHVDALGHVACDGRFHGGAGEEELGLGGLRTLGAESFGPVVTRGVLIDPAAARLRAPLGVEALETWQQRVGGLRDGDCVLVCGAERAMEEAGADRLLDPEAARWLARAGAVAVGCDGLSVERHGSLELHEILLVECGVPIIEGLDLAELAGSGASSFALFLGPIVFRSASAAWLSAAAVL